MPVILATWEAEIRRITVRSQPRQIVHETLSRKNPSQKRASRVAQGVGLEFKPQYHKKKKNFNLQNNSIYKSALCKVLRT
jgi:UDP-N-acetylglucosamine:LPS N-acetylglucosamine transferase